MNDVKPLKDVEYAMRRTGYPDHRIYYFCRQGILPHVKFGRRYKFDPDALEEWIRNGGSRKPDAQP